MATDRSPMAPVQGRGARAWVVAARVALAVAALSALAELAVGPLYRLGALALPVALGTFRWTVWFALGAASVGLFAAAGLVASGTRAARVSAIVAAGVGLAAAAPPLLQYRKLQTLPRIHDVSTDTTNPPRFVAVLPLRAAARNPVEYPPETGTQQRRGYPDIAPLALAAPPAEAFAKAEREARALGWQIVASVPAEGRLEATDTTLLFGFKDDIVVRVAAAGSGAVVDVRSLSRVGGFDFGQNADRVRGYLTRLRS